MNRVAVAAFGPDRPGMVAAITGVLMGHGGNLEDTSMTILRGHFAMMLVVAMPEGEAPAVLEDSLSREVSALGLTVVVRPLGDGTGMADEASASSWSVSVYGSDRPGIVHRITRLLADHGANIVDLSTRVTGSFPDLVYVMLFDITLGASADVDRLQAELATLSEELGVEAHIRPHESDVL
ncbi:MAG: ACT domain-containing protein [Actinobacteria bacterium]|nr:ACT domain-containing protein [Actinomycetota bacterium]